MQRDMLILRYKKVAFLGVFKNENKKQRKKKQKNMENLFFAEFWIQFF